MAMRKSLASIIPVTSLLLAGCAAVGPDYVPPVPSASRDGARSAFVEGWAPAFKSDPLPDRWWQLYANPRLDALVEEALGANTDLRVAAANLERSRAIVAEARARAGVQTGLDAQPSVGEASNLGIGSPAGVHTTFDMGASISYEVDVVGRIRRGIEAVEADAGAQAAAYDLAVITVVADVVDAYSGACAAGAQIAVANRSIALQQQSLALLERGRRAGVGTPLDIARSATLLAQLRAAVPRLESSRRAALYRLAVLLGREPKDFPPELVTCSTVPMIRQALPVGDGAALLRRRPDIREAERQLAAATARIGVATADLYPTISLGASLGSTSRSLDSLVDSAAFRFSAGPLISWSFPNRRVARTRIEQANATSRAALATFDGRVLGALRETETALATYARDIEENVRLTTARDESRKALVLQQRLARGGLASGLETLDAQRTLAQAEAALAASETTIATDRIRLFLALGGGWSDPAVRGAGGNAN
ncbi:efflux transporter outer membrane subunit [Sphingobium sp. CCH11-B1]|uniref:efflux transporter outer membrane subunit n=1 Tax=Sphingobium sp. CCH11-B1 TaxID=1768781 RepID=UPI0009E66091|nr:efflux transporter outer membrane subunit [Sphingobium sp. CCH11-B1]